MYKLAIRLDENNDDDAFIIRPQSPETKTQFKNKIINNSTRITI